jgi:hypothetical protein
VARSLRTASVVAELARPTLKNWNGIAVGGMRPAAVLG